MSLVRTIMIFLLLGYTSGVAADLRWWVVEKDIAIKYPSVDHIKGEDAVEQLSESLIVDVREPEEYSVSHIPGAINITEVKEIVAMAKKVERPVIVYCSVGYRSSAIAELVQDQGISIQNLERSLFGWANLGLPLENISGKTELVHPYNESWGRLLNGDIPRAYEVSDQLRRDAIE